MTMLRLKRKLQTLLKNAERVAVLGIGSELRGDDAVGLLVLDHLQRLKIASARCRSQRKSKGNRGRAGKLVVKLFNGGTAPENLTGEIRRFKPSHLVLIDAVDLGKKPGTIELLNPRDTDNISFFTHKLPIKLMLDYLAGEMKFTQFLIGIQPRDLDVMAPISPAVKQAGRLTANYLCAAVKGHL